MTRPTFHTPPTLHGGYYRFVSGTGQTLGVTNAGQLVCQAGGFDTDRHAIWLIAQDENLFWSLRTAAPLPPTGPAALSHRYLDSGDGISPQLSVPVPGSDNQKWLIEWDTGAWRIRPSMQSHRRLIAATGAAPTFESDAASDLGVAAQWTLTETRPS